MRSLFMDTYVFFIYNTWPSIYHLSRNILITIIIDIIQLTILKLITRSHGSHESTHWSILSHPMNCAFSRLILLLWLMLFSIPSIWWYLTIPKLLICSNLSFIESRWQLFFKRRLFIWVYYLAITNLIKVIAIDFWLFSFWGTWCRFLEILLIKKHGNHFHWLLAIWLSKPFERRLNCILDILRIFG